MEILEIELLTDDIDATASFYTDILGLRLVRKDTNTIIFSAGKTRLIFTASNNKKPHYHFAFNIASNKIEEAIRWAASKFNLLNTGEGGMVANFKSWNAKAIYFYDNNGNILEFIVRFELNNATGKAFGPDAILSVSEIGIVTDNPSALAQQLATENNIPYFSKSIKANDFIVLGDDNGLLIIVATNRSWFPTDIKSQPHYVKIKLVQGGLMKTIAID
ncbi:MAG: VOC family protein [Ferruginibacter sp.]